MGYPDTFEGFAVTDTKKWSQTTQISYTPKPFEEHDVDVEIEACGICGSDVHTATGGWLKPMLPVVPGHEIVGKVVRVGSKVNTLKVGDRCGVGAQVWACLKCDVCKADNETYCPHLVDTYNCKYQDGSDAYGGYASHVRCHEYFAFPIPELLPTEAVAPMLCAGITTYLPLVRNGTGPGKKVGIIGIGGLGHFAIMWARALGAEVYVFSRTRAKEEDARKLGAHHFIATEEKDWEKALQYKLDFVLSCANSSKGFELKKYLSTLNVGKHMVSVGLPEEPFEVGASHFIPNGASLGASHLGSRHEMLDMLALAAKHNITAWHQTLPLSVEGVKEGLERCQSNDCKYRVVLTDYDKAFKK